MGCDIHLYVEYKKDGCWLTADVWEKSRYSDEVGKLTVPTQFEYYGSRAYFLFSKLADCGRCIDDKPIIQNRGFPDDACAEVKAYRDDEGADGHSDSWLTYAELEKENWKDTETIPEEWRVCLGRLWNLSFEKGVKHEEIRIVFWFDN